MKTEAKVGLFITLTLFFLFGLLSQLSSFDNLFQKGYPVSAKIKDGSGLKDKAKVKLKGVDIGYVKKVTLLDNNVVTQLMIDEGIKIPIDSTIVISQDSLLGGKFLDIKPGTSNEVLMPNALLSKEESVSSIADASTAADEAFQEITLLVHDLRDVFNNGGKSNIQETLSNLKEFSSLLASISKEDNQSIHETLANVKEFSSLLASISKEDGQSIHETLVNVKEFSSLLASISQEEGQTIHEILANANASLANANRTINKFALMSDEIRHTSREFTQTSKEFTEVGREINRDLPSIMARINSITQYLDNVSVTLDEKLPPALEKFVKLEDNLNDTINGNKDKLSSALTSVDGFFSESTETMQKVDKYLDGMIKSELHVEMRSDEVYDDGGYSKSHLNLTLKPDPTRYYMLGVTSGPSFQADDTFLQGYAGNKKHEGGKFLLSAQYGKRFDDLLFRVGLIEGQGGFGVDYFALNDTLKVSANMFDFNAVNDIRGENLNLTTTIRYQFFKHINAYISANNILNQEANSISAGIGVSFVDNDLKNLLGTAAAGSSK